MKFLFLLLISLLLSACSIFAPVEIPADQQYVPPQSSPVSLGSLRGSQEDVVLMDDLTAFVLSVDGKVVTNARSGWNVPLMLAPGQRNIIVNFQRAIYNATAAFSLNVMPGSQYELRFSTDLDKLGFRATTYCDFWIVDLATQKPVTDIRRGNLVRDRQTFVPIILPR